MTAMMLIARRELHAYFMSPLGYIITAALLFLNGLAFQAIAMQGQRSSHDVMTMFFFYSCGFVAAAGILFSMRLFAEERQLGTMLLLQSAPVSDFVVVLGKFLGAFLFLVFFLVLTSYMPLMVMVKGHVSWGHIFAGYTGLLLEGAAVIAIGTFASSLTKHQLVAAVLSAVIVVSLFLCWLIGGNIDGALGDVIGYLDFYDSHFRSVSRAILKLSTVVYYTSLTYLGLLGATLVLMARRWRG